MKNLIPNGGIPRSILFVMAVTGGLTVANLYYNQPLLETMRHSLGATELQANLITFVTQLGYALGLIFVVPLADKVSRRKIVSVNMSIAVFMLHSYRLGQKHLDGMGSIYRIGL